MQIRIISFTSKGAAFVKCLVALCQQSDIQAVGYAMEHHAEAFDLQPVCSLSQWVQAGFAAKAAGQCDALVFVGATGIAVRAVAPFLQSKAQDPAVISVDEQGQFVVSLLSGHLGGANQLAATLARLLQATPVISTATDLNHCFAVDTWAVANQLLLLEVSLIKTVSGALLAGREVGLLCQVSLTGDLPPGLKLQSEGQLGIMIGYDTAAQPFAQTLHLVPKGLHLGVGCRKGVGLEQIRQAVEQTLQSHGLPLDAVKRLASIDLKAKEPGLLAFCQTRHFDTIFYRAEELQQVAGGFTPSDFVASVTGVDNVCERAAVKSSGGPLLCKKEIHQAVTVAVAAEPWRVQFGH